MLFESSGNGGFFGGREVGELDCEIVLVMELVVFVVGEGRVLGDVIGFYGFVSGERFWW